MPRTFFPFTYHFPIFYFPSDSCILILFLPLLYFRLLLHTYRRGRYLSFHSFPYPLSIPFHSPARNSQQCEDGGGTRARQRVRASGMPCTAPTNITTVTHAQSGGEKIDRKHESMQVNEPMLERGMTERNINREIEINTCMHIYLHTHDTYMHTYRETEK